MSKKLPWLWPLALAASAAYFFLTYGSLPEKVATHFDASGNPNGFQTKDGYLFFFIQFTLMLNALLGAVFFLLKKIPVSRMNLPRKDYWTSSPERMDVLHQKLGAVLALVATYMNCAFIFAVQAVYQVNTPNAALQIPVNGGVFFILLGALFMVVFAFLILRPPPETLS